MYRRQIFFNETVKRFKNDFGGIYIIQVRKEVVYIGESDNLDMDILNYLSFLTGNEIKLSFYRSEKPKFDPSILARELLQNHNGLFGKLPKLNQESYQTHLNEV